MRVVVLKDGLLYNDQFHKQGAEIDMIDEGLANFHISMGALKKVEKDDRNNKDPVRSQQQSTKSPTSSGH